LSTDESKVLRAASTFVAAATYTAAADFAGDVVEVGVEVVELVDVFVATVFPQPASAQQIVATTATTAAELLVITSP
jgi:hypothetical protein